MITIDVPEGPPIELHRRWDGSIQLTRAVGGDGRTTSLHLEPVVWQLVADALNDLIDGLPDEANEW